MSTKQAQWFGLVSEQQQSGLTIKAFCTAKDIKLCTFHYWRKKYRERNHAPNGFVELTPPAVSSHALRITYPNGVCIDLPAADISLVSQLLRIA